MYHLRLCVTVAALSSSFLLICSRDSDLSLAEIKIAGKPGMQLNVGAGGRVFLRSPVIAQRSFSSRPEATQHRLRPADFAAYSAASSSRRISADVGFPHSCATSTPILIDIDSGPCAVSTGEAAMAP